MSAPASAWPARLREQRWTIGFCAAAFLLMVLHLSGLSSSPPGFYIDESSVGYNAWAVAHTGHDEHGHFLPFYFEAFGEYKNPVYIYALAPLTRILPLTPYTVRLPAALFGLAAAAAMALFAWWATRSRWAALLTLLTAGLTPWLVQESRIGFEVVSMVALLSVMLWCLARAQPEQSVRWYLLAGVALGLSTFAYSTGRVFTAILLIVMALCFAIPMRGFRWLVTGIVPVASVVVLGIYVALHQGAITARYNAISINFDGPSLSTLVHRFISNYADYWDPHFLLTHGDPNLRHSTGWGGMLLVTTLPAILVGAAVCVRRWREPLPRFILLGAVVAPAPASLTAEGTPHSLRAVTMLPFLLAFAAYGWAALAERLRDRRAMAAVLALAVLVETSSYFYDQFVEYPGRALDWFDTGVVSAIQRAQVLGGGHAMFISTTFEAPYIQALFALHPDPPPEGVSAEAWLAQTVRVHIADPPTIAAQARPGDILVLAPGDAVPQTAQVVEVDQRLVGTGAVSIVGAPQRIVELVVIARE